MNYKEWKEKYPNRLVVMSESSSIHVKFYCAYEKDAVILHNATGYKLHQNRQGYDRCGGPDYKKIGDKLRLANISYCIVNGNREIETWEANETKKTITLTINEYLPKIDYLISFLNENNINWQPRELENEITTKIKHPEEIRETSNESYKCADKSYGVRFNDKVSLTSSSTGEIMDILLEQTQIGYEYVKTGGPYEDAEIRSKQFSNAGSLLDDGTVIVSSESPLGKAIVGKHKGQKISFFGPTGERFEYIISQVYVVR